MPTEKEKIAVLGVGNLILKDEGVGIHVINEMEKIELPDNVELIDGGTAGIDIMNMIEGYDKLIVIDVVDCGEVPGTLYRIDPDDLVNRPTLKQSLHQIGLLDALDMAKHFGHYPETIIIGVQPKAIEWGMEPTPELKAKIPDLIKMVLDELGIKDEGRKEE